MPRPPLPKSFTWKGQTWLVDYSNLACPMMADGCTIFAARVIFLRNDLPLRETKEEYGEPEILFHELLHVVTGMDFPAKKLRGHQAITAMQPMAELLGQNPQLLNYFAAAGEAGP